ncbi:MAG: histidine phosphotransferase family protein [Caulobacteraceae bacterium]
MQSSAQNSRASEAAPIADGAARHPPSDQREGGAGTSEVATRLAARLCHDILSPVSGIVSALDLLEDKASSDLHEEAMELIASSARRLTAVLAFSRAAFGSGPESSDPREIEALVRGVVPTSRTSLEWTVSEALSPLAGRALLNLVQMAFAAVAGGGAVRAATRREEARINIEVDACGPNPRLAQEVRAGFLGDAFVEGLSGRWVQAWHLRALIVEAGGVIGADSGEGTVRFRAEIPCSPTRASEDQTRP